MELVIKFKDDEARRLQHFLQRRYSTKALLPRLCKAAIREVAGREAGDILQLELEGKK